MSTEFSDPFQLPPPDLQAEPTEPAIASSQEQEEMQRSRSTRVARSSFDFNQMPSLEAPDIGEPPENLIAPDPSTHDEIPAAAQKNVSSNAVMSRFWLTVLGIAVLLLVAISDWRAKDGPPIPMPNTSRIPQVR